MSSAGVLQLFDIRGKDELEALIDLEEKEEDTGKGRRLLCSACGNAITTQDQGFSVNGSHEHTHTNPHGITYHIGCFRQASGCGHVGPATDEYTWFPGYRWQVAVCGNCGEHVGWLFRGSGGDSFHGLILARLVSEQ